MTELCADECARALPVGTFSTLVTDHCQIVSEQISMQMGSSIHSVKPGSLTFTVPTESATPKSFMVLGSSPGHFLARKLVEMYCLHHRPLSSREIKITPGQFRLAQVYLLTL